MTTWFKPSNWFTILSSMIFIEMGSAIGDNCELYNSLNWDNTSPYFKEIKGIYSVMTTNVADVFGFCEVHGIVQEANDVITNRFSPAGSPCPTVYQNHITKVGTAFQYEFFSDNPLCMLPGARVNALKMNVLDPAGLCFLKAFCLLDGRSVVNMLCRKQVATSLLDSLLNPVVDLVGDLLKTVKDLLFGNPLYDINQSCYNAIVGNSTYKALLLGEN